MIHVVGYHPQREPAAWLAGLGNLPSISKVTILGEENEGLSSGKIAGMRGRMGESAGIGRLLEDVSAPYVLFLDCSERIGLSEGALLRFIDVARITGAGLLYADYQALERGELVGHPLNDYQLGSLRDDFDFGKILFFPLEAIRKALVQSGPLVEGCAAGLYGLRLRVSAVRAVVHIPEYLYFSVKHDQLERTGERLFDYVDPARRQVQIEMEQVATAHLKRIGAWLEPVYVKPDLGVQNYPVEASVVIPVRNRVGTVADAVASALAQETDFSFNVLVVDNHSTDGTTEVLAQYASKDKRIKHLVPERIDLGIGGCWNEAIYSDACGRFAVQLDSDDLYSEPTTLQKIVDQLRTGEYGMVIGSYTLVNEAMQVIPPGLIDHREWTDDNGRNNALRINGLGAPRAFVTSLIRQIGFLNVSYGEDYAAALAVSRRHRIGRIYDSLYWCRRWSGNTDARLTHAQKNRNDAFKDRIRTLEILARQDLNARGTTGV